MYEIPQALFEMFTNAIWDRYGPVAGLLAVAVFVAGFIAAAFGIYALVT